MDSGQGSFNRRQDADDLTDYVNNGWLSSNEFDGPTFLWNHMIREASREGSDQRNDVPVANLSDADTVINMPMQWYFDALASMVPTAERTDTGVEIPRIDMPTFHWIRRHCPVWTRWSAMQWPAHVGLIRSATSPRPWK